MRVCSHFLSQTWISSWLLGGPSHEEFSQKHLPKDYSISMERLYFEPDRPESWKIVSLGHLESKDNRVKLFSRLYSLFTVPPIPTRETMSAVRQSLVARATDHHTQIAMIFAKQSGTKIFESSVLEDLRSCALCFCNQEDQLVLVLFADAFKRISDAVQGCLSRTNDTSPVALHVRFESSSKECKIVQLIIISDDPIDSNPERNPSESDQGVSVMRTHSVSAGGPNSIKFDDTRKFLDLCATNWTLVSVNGLSDELGPPSQPGAFRRTDIDYANAVTKSVLNPRLYGCRFQINFKSEENKSDLSNPLCFQTVREAAKHFEPLRLPIPQLAGQHLRGPIKQVSRTISKVVFFCCPCSDNNQFCVRSSDRTMARSGVSQTSRDVLLSSIPPKIYSNL